MDIRHVDALDMCFAAVAARQEADRAIAERERLARSIRRAGASDHPAGLRSVRVRVGHALLRAGAALAGFSLDEVDRSPVRIAWIGSAAAATAPRTPEGRAARAAGSASRLRPWTDASFDAASRASRPSSRWPHRGRSRPTA